MTISTWKPTEEELADLNRVRKEVGLPEIHDHPGIFDWPEKWSRACNEIDAMAEDRSPEPNQEAMMDQLTEVEAMVEAVVARIQKNDEASEEVEEGLIDILNRIDDMKTEANVNDQTCQKGSTE